MSETKLAQLTDQVLALSKTERFRLAQDLWQSLEDETLPGWSASDLETELRQRAADEPDAAWKSHGEVMAEARRVFGCGK